MEVLFLRKKKEETNTLTICKAKNPVFHYDHRISALMVHLDKNVFVVLTVDEIDRLYNFKNAAIEARSVPPVPPVPNHAGD